MPVANPSELFLGDRATHALGQRGDGAARRDAAGARRDSGARREGGLRHAAARGDGLRRRRLALLLAVLDKRGGLSFAQLDVFLNVVGGVRLQEPAGDLAVAAALASSVYDRPVPADAMFLGEVGLGGEIRPVSQAERRLAEAARTWGCRRAFLPNARAEARARAARRVRRRSELRADSSELTRRDRSATSAW